MARTGTREHQVQDTLKVGRLMAQLEDAVNEFYKWDSPTIEEVEVITRRGTLLHPYPATRTESARSYGPYMPYRLADGRLGLRARIGKKRYVVVKSVSEFVLDIASKGTLTPSESIAALKRQLEFFRREPL